MLLLSTVPQNSTKVLQKTKNLHHVKKLSNQIVLSILNP